MFSNKVVYYYFCSFISVSLFICVIVGTVLTLSEPGIADWSYVKKCLLWWAIFTTPPVLYKLFAKEDTSDKKKNPLAIYRLIWTFIWIILMGVASGLLKAGMTKAAVWVYITTPIPVFFIFLPLYYGIFDYFNNKN